MTATMYLLAALVVTAVLYVALRKPVREYIRMRGTRVVPCPDDGQPVAVTIDAGHAALTSAVGAERFRVETCTRWPAKAGCGQECLKQIEAQPMDCLVRTQVSRWYTGKTCAICGKALGMIDWTERQPALRAPGGETLEWRDVQPERLHEVMATHAPVCWDCHVAETFRRQRPDLVIDNPFTPSARPPR